MLPLATPSFGLPLHQALRCFTFALLTVFMRVHYSKPIQVSAETWNWRHADKELFIHQFQELRIIGYYIEVRKQLVGEGATRATVAPEVRGEKRGG